MLHVSRRTIHIGLLGATLLTALCWADDSDIPKTFTTPTANQDYIKREAMIPMRDGVKLYTVIVVPKGASNAPILLTRTPYNATNRALRSNSEHSSKSFRKVTRCSSKAAIQVFQTCAANTSPRATIIMTPGKVRGPLEFTDHVTDATTPSTGWSRARPNRTDASA